jgi:RNA polymerase sigma factor (sigma-70 family)
MLEGSHGPVWPPAEIEARFGSWIRAKVRRLFPNEVDDLTQDVMLKLIHALPNLRDSRVEAARAFVSRTVRSVCIDAWRRREKRPAASALGSIDLADPAATLPDAAAIAAEGRARVRLAWDSLPERERTILRLRFEDGLGFREIAEVLGAPPGSIAGWYSRALATLREGMK